jgi:hypothetical protein
VIAHAQGSGFNPQHQKKKDFFFKEPKADPCSKKEISKRITKSPLIYEG